MGPSSPRTCGSSLQAAFCRAPGLARALEGLVHAQGYEAVHVERLRGARHGLRVLGRDGSRPADALEAREAPGGAAPVVIVTGKMSCHANVRMVVPLAHEIMPRVWPELPSISLRIVGEDPPPVLRRPAPRPGGGFVRVGPCRHRGAAMLSVPGRCRYDPDDTVPRPRAPARHPHERAMTKQPRLHFRFFGAGVRVTCDAQDVRDALARIYERQRIPHAPAQGPDLDVSVQVRGVASPRVTVGQRRVRAPCREQLLHYAHLALVNAAAASARDRQVLHGAALARDGRAITLVAPSGGGKTTLALALALRGWQVLSDDFTVLRTDGTVEPFPRRLNVTEATLAMLGLPLPLGAVRVASPGRATKWMVHADDVVPHAVGGPARLQVVFVVQDGPGGSAEGPSVEGPPAEEPGPDRPPDRLDGPCHVDRSASLEATGRWQVQVDHVPEHLVERLREVPGMRSVSVRSVPREAPVLALVLDRGAPVVRRLEAILAVFDVAVLSVSRPGGVGPGPPKRPHVESLGIGDAVEAVLPHDIGLSGRRFLRGTRVDDVTAAARSLAGALGALEGRLYRLWPGDVEATADRIERTAGLSAASEAACGLAARPPRAGGDRRAATGLPRG